MIRPERFQAFTKPLLPGLLAASGSPLLTRVGVDQLARRAS